MAAQVHEQVESLSSGDLRTSHSGTPAGVTPNNGEDWLNDRSTRELLSSLGLFTQPLEPPTGFQALAGGYDPMQQFGIGLFPSAASTGMHSGFAQQTSTMTVQQPELNGNGNGMMAGLPNWF